MAASMSCIKLCVFSLLVLLNSAEAASDLSASRGNVFWPLVINPHDNLVVGQIHKVEGSRIPKGFTGAQVVAFTVAVENSDDMSKFVADCSSPFDNKWVFIEALHQWIPSPWRSVEANIQACNVAYSMAFPAELPDQHENLFQRAWKQLPLNSKFEQFRYVLLNPGKPEMAGEKHYNYLVGRIQKLDGLPKLEELLPTESPLPGRKPVIFQVLRDGVLIDVIADCDAFYGGMKPLHMIMLRNYGQWALLGHGLDDFDLADAPAAQACYVAYGIAPLQNIRDAN